MKQANLYRVEKDTGEGTFGVFVFEGKQIGPTLERGWHDNKVGLSCIPADQYICKRDHTGRHRYWKVLDVKGRTDIELHPLNFEHESQGCIGIGSCITKMRNPKTKKMQRAILRSRDAFEILDEMVGEDNTFLLNIINMVEL